jgi:serine/threonine-protein kinase RsbW
MTFPKPTDPMQWKYPAAIENVELVCQMVTQRLDEYPLQKKDRFAVEILLRESLNNAVLHGCRQDPLLYFSCGLVISNQEIIIRVSDDGAGFDWRKKLKSPPNNSHESGRGLYIYALYANRIQYNDAGNQVTLTRIFNQGE